MMAHCCENVAMLAERRDCKRRGTRRAGATSLLAPRWPDIIVGCVIAALFLRSAFSVLRDATRARVACEWLLSTARQAATGRSATVADRPQPVLRDARQRFSEPDIRAESRWPTVLETDHLHWRPSTAIDRLT